MSNHSKPTKTQAQKFEEAAREVEVDDDEAAFERRLKDVANAPPSRDEKPKKKKTPAK